MCILIQFLHLKRANLETKLLKITCPCQSFHLGLPNSTSKPTFSNVCGLHTRGSGCPSHIVFWLTHSTWPSQPTETSWSHKRVPTTTLRVSYYNNFVDNMRKNQMVQGHFQSPYIYIHTFLLHNNAPKNAIILYIWWGDGLLREVLCNIIGCQWWNCIYMASGWDRAWNDLGSNVGVHLGLGYTIKLDLYELPLVLKSHFE